VSPLSLQQLEALARIDSPTVSNAIEFFKVRDPTAGYASMELHCQYPQLPAMVGYAVTCTADSTSPAPKQPNAREKLLEAIAAAHKPAVVVIKDIGPQRLRSCHVGDVLSSIFKKLGAIGLVTDGGVRDLAGIAERAPGFQVFAAGQVVSHGVPVFTEVGVTVNICGLTVRPGDLLHGDANGLLAIPLDIADQVAAQAQKVWERESGIVNFLSSKDFSLEELHKRLGH
jgi:4-hydroxy-4-methyl-2-oxoglutarate aldolase